MRGIEGIVMMNRNNREKRNFLRTAAAALSLGLALTFCVPSVTVSAENVNDDGVNVRSEPSTSGGVIGLLYKSDKFTVIGEKTDKQGNVWVQIRLKDDRTGYVSAKYVEGYKTQAEKKKEEEAKKKKEEEAKKKAEEEAKKKAEEEAKKKAEEEAKKKAEEEKAAEESSKKAAEEAAAAESSKKAAEEAAAEEASRQAAEQAAIVTTEETTTETTLAPATGADAALEGDAALYTGLADSLTVSDAPAGLQEGTLQLPGYGIALLLRS